MSDYAKFRGITRQTVHRWVREGRLFVDDRGHVLDPVPSPESFKTGQKTKPCPLCAGTGKVHGEGKDFKEMHDDAILAAANQEMLRRRKQTGSEMAKTSEEIKAWAKEVQGGKLPKQLPRKV